MLINENVYMQTFSNLHKLIDHHPPTPILQSPNPQQHKFPMPPTQCSNLLCDQLPIGMSDDELDTLYYWKEIVFCTDK